MKTYSLLTSVERNIIYVNGSVLMSIVHWTTPNGPFLNSDTIRD